MQYGDGFYRYVEAIYLLIWDLYYSKISVSNWKDNLPPARST
jgi:hypothetical protein